jgi:hypothetical protein
MFLKDEKLTDWYFRSGEVYSIQHYVIKFVSDLRWWFSLSTPVSSTNNTKLITYNIVESCVKHHNTNPGTK